MTLGATLVTFAASAQPLSDIDRYLQRADQETRAAEYEAPAVMLDLVLALYSMDSVETPAALLLRYAEVSLQAGHHVEAAGSATRFLLASDLPVEHNQECCGSGESGAGS